MGVVSTLNKILPDISFKITVIWCGDISGPQAFIIIAELGKSCGADTSCPFSLNLLLSLVGANFHYLDT